MRIMAKVIQKTKSYCVKMKVVQKMLDSQCFLYLER